MMPAALPVAEGRGPPPSGPPATAEEYLRQVRWEARQCDRDLRERAKAAAAAAEAGAGPDTDEPRPGRAGARKEEEEEGEEEQEKGEEEDKAHTAAWPGGARDVQERAAWRGGVVRRFGAVSASLRELAARSASVGIAGTEARVAWVTRCVSEDPGVRAVASLRDAAARQLLEDLADELEESEKLPDCAARWCYALLARVEKPLPARTLSSLRALRRRLDPLAAATRRRRSRVMCSVLAAVLEGAFGQSA